jgi:hypothetical protein
MIAIGLLFVRMLCDCSKSRRRLEAEILILRPKQKWEEEGGNKVDNRAPLTLSISRSKVTP